MAVSTNTGHRQQRTFWERVFGQLSRYDLVLTAIPLLFAVGLLIHVLFTVPFAAAVAVGAVLSVVVVIDALFVNPPVAENSESR